MPEVVSLQNLCQIRRKDLTDKVCITDILGHDHYVYSDTLDCSDISPNRDLITEIDLIAVFDVITLFRKVSVGRFRRVRLAGRGRLLFRTPGLVPFGTCICSNVKTILS